MAETEQSPEQKESARRRALKAARQSTNSADYAFDADAIAKARGEAPITIGGVTYHRRVKDNAVSRQALDISEDQTTSSELVDRVERQIEALGEDEVEKRAELRKQRRAHLDEALDKNYDLAVLLLQDEVGNPPPREALEAMDYEVLVDLTRELAEGGEPLDPPTETSDSST